MLVLNTTSPWASPSAPAAAPRNRVPSSSARIASIWFEKFYSVVRAGCIAKGGSWCGALLLHRRGDAVLFVRHHADRRGPTVIPVALEANGVRAGRDLRHRQRRRADDLVVEKHRRAGRARDDGEAAAEAG